MASTLVYTFRTNKHLDAFRKIGVDIFVFGKLNDDIIKFQKLVDDTQPTLIIGVAEVKGLSRFETLAVNVFGKNGRVNRNGKDSYKLYVPPQIDFPKSRKTTNSFCNWTMCRISELVDSKHTKVSFLHFSREDIPKVLDFLK